MVNLPGNTPEEQFKYVMVRKLTKQDSFDFKCKKCGKCCKLDIVVLLSPADIFRIAKHLCKPTVYVIQTYTEWYIGKDSKFPIFIFKNNAGVCPMLFNNKCRIDSVKPAVCRLYPLGRAEMESELIYFLQDVECGQKGCSVVVEDWIKEYATAASERNYRRNNELMTDLITNYLRNLHKKMGDVIYSQLCNQIVDALYVHYDTEKDFIVQLEENYKMLTKYLDEVMSALD